MVKDWHAYYDRLEKNAERLTFRNLAPNGPYRYWDVAMAYQSEVWDSDIEHLPTLDSLAPLAAEMILEQAKKREKKGLPTRKIPPKDRLIRLIIDNLND